MDAVTENISSCKIMETWNMQKMYDVWKAPTQAFSYSNCAWFSFSYFSISVNY